LLTKTDVSDDLEGLLEKVLQDPAAISELADQLGVESDKANNKGEGA
jgi:predicted component of type VI protein secretion system